MKFIRYRAAQFFIWISIVILAAVWIIFRTITNANLIFSPTYLFVFVLGCLSFIMAIFSIRKKVEDAKTEMNEEKFKQENVKDYLLYQQLLNPPEINN